MQKHFLCTASFHPHSCAIGWVPPLILFHGWGNRSTERRGSVAAITESKWQPHSRAPTVPWLWHLFLGNVRLGNAFPLHFEPPWEPFISLSFLWQLRVGMCIVASFSVPQVPHLQNGNNNWLYAFVSKDCMNYCTRGKHAELCLTHSKFNTWRMLDINWLDYCFSNKNVSSSVQLTSVCPNAGSLRWCSGHVGH